MPAVLSAEEEVVQRELTTLLDERSRRAAESRRVNRYIDGGAPIPEAVVRAKMTKAYRLLIPMAEAPWGDLVVGSAQDRLEVSGLLSDADTEAAKQAWDLWQRNGMDAESKLLHNSLLIDGRAFTTIWPSEEDPDEPEIVLDNAEQMVVGYKEGRRRPKDAQAAVRYWSDGKRNFCTLYRRDDIWKFQSVKEDRGSRGFKAGNEMWEPREVNDEDFPLSNPYSRVPVVEFRVNERLKAGRFPSARGEFSHCTGLIDRINLLTFLGLVVALWMGFPLRGVIGQRITKEMLTDDNNEPLLDDDGKKQYKNVQPFDAHADSFFQLEDHRAQLAEYKPADRKNLGVFPELDQLAVVTKTPRHYFPLEQGMSNISADAIRASEGGLSAKTTGHKASAGEPHEETLRIAGKMRKDSYELPPDAEIQWKDHESRSMAERADAATKVASIGAPWQLIASKYLNLSQDEISAAEAQGASSALTKLLADATAGMGSNGGTPTPAPAPAV